MKKTPNHQLKPGAVYNGARDLEVTISKRFAKRARSRRIELELTQKELGVMLGITRSTVTRMESGSLHNSQFFYIARLAVALKVCPEYFFTEKDPKVLT